MPITNDLMKNIISDMRVELSDMFDRNFERKAFFGEKWPDRKKAGKGSLLVVTGAMRRSVQPYNLPMGVGYSSALPYAPAHNDGGVFKQNVRPHTKKKDGKSYKVKAHTRTITMPQRRFIGDSKEVQAAIKKIVTENLNDYFNQLAKEIKK